MPNLLTPPRVEVEELLDEHDAPREDVERSLHDLRRINQWLGGRRAWRRLTRLASGRSDTASVLEIGTGTSDLLESVPDVPLRIGLDLNIVHLIHGRAIGDHSIVRVVGDALNLPFRDGSIDIAGSSHFFHHFSLAENELIIAECLRVCRRGTFVTDTRRHRLPLLFVKLLGVTGVVGRITRFDAPASVIRSYTLGEIRSFARRFNEISRKVIRIMPFRFALVLWKERTVDG